MLRRARASAAGRRRSWPSAGERLQLVAPHPRAIDGVHQTGAGGRVNDRAADERASDFWRLLDAACSGGLTPEQRSQLGACLEGSLEAQEIFVDHLLLCASECMVERRTVLLAGSDRLAESLGGEVGSLFGSIRRVFFSAGALRDDGQTSPGERGGPATSPSPTSRARSPRHPRPWTVPRPSFFLDCFGPFGGTFGLLRGYGVDSLVWRRSMPGFGNRSSIVVLPRSPRLNGPAIAEQPRWVGLRQWPTVDGNIMPCRCKSRPSPWATPSPWNPGSWRLLTRAVSA